jgi:hypothetical protein
MEYRFVHHWNYALGEEEHRILEAAISLTMQDDREHLLKDSAAFIAEHTQAMYVLIGVLNQDNSKIQTCAFLKNGQELENFTYLLQNTPCDSVLTQRFCYYPVDVKDSFPEDEELKELNIESYLGSIFLSEDSEQIGLIALMDEKPIERAAFAEHLILVLSPAIEEELIRLRA